MKIESYLRKSPVFRFLDYALVLERKINESIADSSLSYYQALVLVSIYSEGCEVTLKDLNQVFPMTKSGLSQTLSLLESKQLVKRLSHADKRAYLFRVTATGEKIALQLMGALENLEQKFEEKPLFRLILELDSPSSLG